MISLDTNVLVRFFAKDDPQQLHEVLELFHKLENQNQQAYIPLLVILETIWVLGHFYKIERLQIIENLLILFNMPILIIENANVVRQMLVEAQYNTFNLSDLLIGCCCAVVNNLPVVTFDKKASKIDNFIAMKQAV